ncbi:MAG: hypothetical protein Q8L54_12400 [Devosia sp.]|nr:hypothetical protein [Devosia sp.]
MHKFAYQTLGLAAAFVATGALAEATRPLDALGACRLDDSRVALRFTFEGGACQQPGEPFLARGKDGIGNVTVPTANVGEICTMQIVPVQFAGVVDAPETITTLDITVLKPNGNRQALGSTDVATGPEECVEPEAKAAE